MGVQPNLLLGVENCLPGGFIFQKQHSHIPELDTAEMCHQSLAPVEADEQPDRPDLLEQIFQINISPGDCLKVSCACVQKKVEQMTRKVLMCHVSCLNFKIELK